MSVRTGAVAPVGRRRRAVIICPMEIERAAVARAVRAASSRLSRAGSDRELPRIIRSGIGRDAILAALERAVRSAAGDQQLVILAGACGALRPVADVPLIARVIDEHGRSWHGGIGFDPGGVTLIAVDRIVSTPADKRSLAEASGAAIVDMESHAFSRRCEELAVSWAIVRGVSDTPEQTLPERVLHWITPDGRTRVLRAAFDLALRPGLVPHVRAVLARSRSVLPQVGERAASIASAWLSEH